MSPAAGSGPGYLRLHRTGELAARAAQARERLHACALCPRECGVDRLSGELGWCRTGALARVASYGPHFGEEAPLVGRGGSGTIFFAGCSLACVFCQNHDISQPEDDPPPAPGAVKAGTPAAPRRGAAPLPEAATRGTGSPAAASAGRDTSGAAALAGVALPWERSPELIAQIMLDLQALGCENINFVSPSHVVPQIIEALDLAAADGLDLHLVYNTGGYDSLQTLRLLDGVVDIYMPDMKYADDAVGARLSGVPDYATRNREAVLEMHRQVGDLQLDERGVARRGLLVRHLVLPDGLAGTAATVEWLASEVSPDTYLNVMEQYRPAHRVSRGLGQGSSRYDDIARRPTVAECSEATAQALAAGLWRLDGLDWSEGPPRPRPLGEETQT